MSWPDSSQGDPIGDGRHASVTDRPDSLEALRDCVIKRAEEGLAIYPRGGGTALDYGGVPRAPGAAIDTRSLAQVIDYPAADMTITVQAGMTLSALNAVLAEANQRLPLDVPFPEQATLGGVYATNTSGPRRFGAGRPRDMIIGVGFVSPQGEILKGGGRVVKNVAGYDFPKLLTGSLGTLGIITQLTLKVRPRPEATVLAWVPFQDLAALGNTLDALNSSGTRPMAVEVLNHAAAERASGVVSAAPAAPWHLVIGYEDNATSIAWQLDRLRTELGDHGRALVTLQGGESVPLWNFLTEFQAHAIGPVTIVANVRPSSTARFCSKLSPDRWAVQAHAGNGIIRGHALGETPLETLASEIDRLRAEAVGDGGNLILSRCPTDWKSRLRVWGEPRADWAIAEKIKHTFDPRGVMNPGRFVGTI